MVFNQIYEFILSEVRSMEIVDAHEHLPPEKVRVSLKPDVCFLFSHYIVNDLISAGCRPWGITARERRRLSDYLRDSSRPIEERWGLIEPYIKFIKYGTYYRALAIALKEVYGYDEINSANYKEISERMKEDNKPGIYDRILRGVCKAKFILPQYGRIDYEKGYMKPVMWINTLVDIGDFKKLVEELKEKGYDLREMEDYLKYMEDVIVKWKRSGVVGVKTITEPYIEPPSLEEANKIFKEGLRRGVLERGKKDSLRRFLREKIIEICGKYGLVVAIHSGVWDDFRRLDPRHNIPLFYKYPEVKFDLYHMGMPWVRSTAFIGKNFHNVYLNLCWSHIVSMNMARAALLEYVDIVPVNKIIAFGGDYNEYSFEKVVGHLRMAQENIAWVLAKLVNLGRMSKDEAVEVARMWFYENPVRIYSLE